MSENRELGDYVSEIHSDIARLARHIHGSSERSVSPDAVLQTVTESAVSLVPGVDHAGVSLVRKRRKGELPELESKAPTSNAARQFDDLQHSHGVGPCLEAIWKHETVMINDLAHEDRWPAFTAAILEQTPVRSSLAMRLFTTDDELGALNLYSEVAGAFDDDIADIAAALAAHAAIALSSARRGEQFRSALASRDSIGQAKGMIMERYRTDALHAFDILRKLSQEANIPLAEVARKIIDNEQPT